MNWLPNTLLLLVGLVILAGGGEFVVRGAARLARRLGVSALVVGLTIIAFGTSAPEAAVSVIAALNGEEGLAVGNIVGSNVANILLILGMAALARPLKVSRNLINTDVPFMIVVTGLFMLMVVSNTRVDRWEGVLLLLGLCGYTYLTYVMSRREAPHVEAEYQQLKMHGGRTWVHCIMIVAGIAGLVIGANLIVRGATGIAVLFGVSDRVIGLTIVAIGTSLPELATCIVAARRNQPDIAIGNIIGSNIFNILSVAGIAAVVKPLEVPSETRFVDAPFMLAIAVLAFFVCWKGRTIRRSNGVVLIALYLAFLSFTTLSAADTPSLARQRGDQSAVSPTLISATSYTTSLPSTTTVALSPTCSPSSVWLTGAW